MSVLSNPKLAAIDDALNDLEPCLTEFGQTHGFTFLRSHEHSYNIPRRWLHREAAGIRHEIGLVIALQMPERLKHGFFPEIPCTLYIAAFERERQMHYSASVFEAVSFSSLRTSLPGYLLEAERKLQVCTSAFICEHGAHDATM
jgi:hypothetical protein